MLFCSAVEVAVLSESHDLCINGDCFEMLQSTEAVLQVIPYVKVCVNRLHPLSKI
jgi:manganese-transporting P-type ATPase